jgi:hypothetical protein
MAENTRTGTKDPDCSIEDFIRALGAKSRNFPPYSLVISLVISNLLSFADNPQTR